MSNQTLLLKSLAAGGAVTCLAGALMCSDSNEAKSKEARNLFLAAAGISALASYTFHKSDQSSDRAAGKPQADEDSGPK